MAVSGCENKGKDSADSNTALGTGVAAAGFVKTGNPPNTSEVVAQQNVHALNLRNK